MTTMPCDGDAKSKMAAWRRLLAGSIGVCGALLLCVPAHADHVIPSGGFESLSSGRLDLGCTDLIVGGTLQTNSSAITNVRNLVIQSGGLIDGGSSIITVGGNWTNSGAFTPVNGTVSFGDACGVNPATISGNSTFQNINFASGVGKTWQFATGSTQIVQNLLNIQGAPSNPLRFSSTVPGQNAFITATCAQITALNFGSIDVLGNGCGLFGVSPPAQIPATSPTALLILILMIGIGAYIVSPRFNRKIMLKRLRSSR